MTTTFKQDFAAALDVQGVSDIVGEKIFPGVAKQGTQAPYVVWRRNGGDPLATLSGASRNRVQQNVLVGCYAATYDAAVDLADAVFDALATASTRLRIVPRPPSDDFDPDTKLFVSVVEASVFHRPSN